MNNVFQEISHIPHFHCIRVTERQLIARFLLQNSALTLDLGCGDGMFRGALDLDEVVGIDRSLDAIEMAKSRGGYSGLVQGDAASLPFRDEIFSCIISNCAIEHMDGLDRVLKEIQRVSVGGNQLILTVPTPYFFDFVRRDDILKSVTGNIEDMISRYNSVHNHVNIYSLQEWKGLLLNADFTINRHWYYLPDTVGEFVSRMDMLYTVDPEKNRGVISRLEQIYSGQDEGSIKKKMIDYMMDPMQVNSGTHLLIDARKN